MSLMQKEMQYAGLLVSNVPFEHIKKKLIKDIDSCLKATLKPPPFRWEMFCKSLKKNKLRRDFTSAQKEKESTDRKKAHLEVDGPFKVIWQLE